LPIKLLKTPSQIPTEIEELIEKILLDWNLSLKKDSRKIAEAILRLSDFFINHPDNQTPWKESWAQLAYIAYFLPLNFLRIKAVVEEGLKFRFFEGLDQLYDFGAGPGTATMALHSGLTTPADAIFPFKINLIETSDWPARLITPHHALLKGARWYHNMTDLRNNQPSSSSLVVFSYSLTEQKQLPPWALESEALMILEPSIQSDGRQLMKLRQNLIENGYHILAPCTHQRRCPLLNQSKTDWCHDRIWLDSPDWFKSFEKHLPMKNETLTMSYLLARKNPRIIEKYNFQKANLARVVGDPLREKGKVRQLLCRGEQREFLTWLDRHKNYQEINRGKLIQVPQDIESKANELRITKTYLTSH